MHMQFIYAGKKSTLSVGNVKAIGDMPEGTVICNVEEVSQVAHFQWAEGTNQRNFST